MIEKDFIHKGFRCIVYANKHMGHRCGYVGVDKKHMLYGFDYNDYVLDKDRWKYSPEYLAVADALEKIRVHGGLTYSGSGNYPVKSDLWWFGFDCGHCYDACDLSIMDESRRNIFEKINVEYSNDRVIRTSTYVEQECKKLAEQLVCIKEEK